MLEGRVGGRRGDEDVTVGEWGEGDDVFGDVLGCEGNKLDHRVPTFAPQSRSAQRRAQGLGVSGIGVDDLCRGGGGRCVVHASGDEGEVVAAIVALASKGRRDESGAADDHDAHDAIVRPWQQ